ncbi:carbohydrate-binding module family 20 domain-containing protein [Agaribacterium haliotis]|uniref:carbohydrate-binding module family 20 domain-containing protein n=1 Tax=Agaribacterium haliotis TaxID=2013869 RepID=UPI001EFCBBAE|nr:carbohydrate-binding module family 20 domain-containing protein [Agaribacterium haliotis]
MLIFSCLFFSNKLYAGAFVHLFEWQWDDIASECENHLAPAGYTAVQVSPPQQSIDGPQWWTRYQPVSYHIQGRSGGRSAFAAMVERCNAAGVDIYVDAVINHMAAWDRSFPVVPYRSEHFHNCVEDIDYSDAWSVQNCDLVGLNDLATENDYVRDKIATYLNDLLALGVAGFRIDAAKHMPADDIADIVSRLHGQPYIYQEVIGGGGEPITPEMYSHIGAVTEFNFTRTIGHFFKGRGELKELRNIGLWDGWLNSNTAVTFVANHDNQRQDSNNTITHKDGNDINILAHVFALAWPYGYPKVMSSYDWSDHDQGPPSHGASSCSGGWLCEHRELAIANMAGFRKHTDGSPVENWWSKPDNGNQVAFARSQLGYVVINGDRSQSLNEYLYTGLPAGQYCNLALARYSDKHCQGPSIEVEQNGYAQFNVAARQSAILSSAAMLSADNNNDCRYPSMYLRGSFNNWASQAMSCVDGVWHIKLKLSAMDEFKFDAFADWSTNWGDNDKPGKHKKRRAEANGKNIQVYKAGDYQISFNDETLKYRFRKNKAQMSDNRKIHFTCANAFTEKGQALYISGDIEQLGNWDIDQAVKLTASDHPNWSKKIKLPKDREIQWKCLKISKNAGEKLVEWQAGENNILDSQTTRFAHSYF